MSAVSPTALETPARRSFRLQREDLVVKAVSVQGGEAEIEGEKTAYARILMSGIACYNGRSEAPATRRRQAVLTVAQVGGLVEGLGDVLNAIARATPTPLAPAMGPWAWTSDPLSNEDLLVVETEASGISMPGPRGMSPTVRVDFIGTSVGALASSLPAVHVHGAIFAGPRQVQTLISSLKKVVRSALEERRVEAYVSSDRAFMSVTSSYSTFGF